MKTRHNSSKFDRDPNKYLGIDRTAEKIRKMSLGVIIWDINTGEVFCRKCAIIVKESSEIEEGKCRKCSL